MKGKHKLCFPLGVQDPEQMMFLEQLRIALRVYLWNVLPRRSIALMAEWLMEYTLWGHPLERFMQKRHLKRRQAWEPWITLLATRKLVKEPGYGFHRTFHFWKRSCEGGTQAWDQQQRLLTGHVTWPTRQRAASGGRASVTGHSFSWYFIEGSQHHVLLEGLKVQHLSKIKTRSSHPHRQTWILHQTLSQLTRMTLDTSKY